MRPKQACQKTFYPLKRILSETTGYEKVLVSNNSLQERLGFIQEGCEALQRKKRPVPFFKVS